MADNSPLLIPEPDYDDPKEPYAFFGFAAYQVQCFEQSLILLILALESLDQTAERAPKDYEETLARLDRQTMGSLIKQLSAIAELPSGFAARLPSLLRKRNYLIHHFFEQNSDKPHSQSGRQAMIDELRSLAEAFYEGDKELVAIYTPLWSSLGATEEIVQRGLEELKRGDHP